MYGAGVVGWRGEDLVGVGLRGCLTDAVLARAGVGLVFGRSGRFVGRVY
jgi:hypothetical protein